MKMCESMYPKCPICGKGTLLPFFDSSGKNIYVCTVCLSKFGMLTKGYPSGKVVPYKGDYDSSFGYEKGNKV